MRRPARWAPAEPRERHPPRLRRLPRRVPRCEPACSVAQKGASPARPRSRRSIHIRSRTGSWATASTRATSSPTSSPVQRARRRPSSTPDPDAYYDPFYDAKGTQNLNRMPQGAGDVGRPTSCSTRTPVRGRPPVLRPGRVPRVRCRQAHGRPGHRLAGLRLPDAALGRSVPLLPVRPRRCAQRVRDARLDRARAARLRRFPRRRPADLGDRQQPAVGWVADEPREDLAAWSAPVSLTASPRRTSTGPGPPTCSSCRRTTGATTTAGRRAAGCATPT